MPTRTAGLGRKPYVAGLVVPTAPTFTAVAPTTAAKTLVTQALTLTGTFTSGVQYMLICDGVAEGYCGFTNATTLTFTLNLSNKTVAAHLLRVMDSNGQGAPAAGVTFTIT
jgi:hypothetical protein